MPRSDTAGATASDAPAPLATGHRPILGALVMLSALAILPGMDAIARYLSLAKHMPTLEIVWGRYVFYLLSMAPVAVWKYRGRMLRPARPGLQLIRGAALAGSAFTFFLAIARMPLADTMAVFFVYPLLVLIVSALLLRERIGPFRWTMVFMGFVGAILVIRPGISGVSPGVPYALLSGAGYAGAMMITRRLASFDPSLITGAISGLVGALVYSAAVPFFWRTPDSFDWILMALMGVIAAGGHFMLITAHRMATAAQLAPLGYIEIVSSICFGLLVFGDWPKPIVWIGIVVIVASGIAVTWSNSRVATEGA